MKALIKRELAAYFYSPVAYVFIVIFLFSTVGSTFFLGQFFMTNHASLETFFVFHPWLYLFLIPAIGMGLWAEERAQGTIEILFTLPVSLIEIVLAKFLAGWFFIGVALLLTFPMPLTIAYLGDPDWGVLLLGYLGSFLMAGSYLSITLVTSALTRNQVISFILSVMVCFTLVLLGWGVFTELITPIFGVALTDVISSFSFSTHFQGMTRGIIDFRDIIFFLSITVGGLYINAMILEAKKGA
ncbi:MAG: ABC transporter permease subunit [SAR324 cluster bacterium]|nr:ABC transporter permease subunit [SAR324 cluster bacterium]